MNIRTFGSPSKRLSLAAMFLAFTLIFLYLSCILPAGRFFMYFVSSLFAIGLMIEGESLLAFLMFVAASAVSLLIMPNIVRVLPYVLFFGHYGIFKHIVERMKDKFAVMVLKMLYFNAALAGMYFLCYLVLIEDLPMELPLWVILVAAQVVFIIYDFCYSRIAIIYSGRLRKWLNK